MKITVAGIGYVGLSLATLLSQSNEVIALDVIKEKIEKVNNRISPIKDEYIEKYFQEKNLNLKATLDWKEALKDADYVIISTPTNYDEVTNFFDTSLVEDIIKKELKEIEKESIDNQEKYKQAIEKVLSKVEYYNIAKKLKDLKLINGEKE